VYIAVTVEVADALVVYTVVTVVRTLVVVYLAYTQHSVEWQRVKEPAAALENYTTSIDLLCTKV
jgi:hypothetical protein